MATYRYLDKDRNVLEEQDFGTVQDAEEHRLSVLGAEIIEEVEDSGTPELTVLRGPPRRGMLIGCTHSRYGPRFRNPFLWRSTADATT